jgi:2-methylcitrate dehydratase
MPAQYELERILRDDVQALFKKVHTSPSDKMTARYPAEAPTGIKITMTDGRVFEVEKPAYEGHFSTPMKWDSIVDKFEKLAVHYTSAGLRREIIDAVSNLENITTKDLARLLRRVKPE